MAQATVELFHFAQMKDVIGKASQEITIEENVTVEMLFDHLKKRYALPLEISYVRCAINDQFVALDTHLSHGDKVVFIPPVSGG